MTKQSMRDNTFLDTFDARVLAAFLHTDHAHLHALQLSSEAQQELKLLTRDYARLVREQTRLVNRLAVSSRSTTPGPSRSALH